MVASHLVDLVQKHERILHPCLLQSGHNPARHGAHVGSSVAADFRLVPHAAQTDPHIFLVQRLGHAAGNGGFSGSGRTDQADDRTFALLCQASHGKEFQNPLLHLFQTIMIPLQNILGPLQVRIILRCLIPGKLQKRFQIASLHGSFRTSLPQTFETADLPADLVLHLTGSLQPVKLRLKLLRIGTDRILSQLLTDIIHLFAQHVITLIFIHPRFHLLRQLRSDSGNPNFLVQNPCQNLIAGIQIHRLKHRLLFLIIHGHAFNHFIHQPSQADAAVNAPFHRLTDSRKIRGKFQEQLLQAARHGLFLYLHSCPGSIFLSGVSKMGRRFHRLYLSQQECTLLRKSCQSSSLLSFHKDTHHIFRQSGNLSDLRQTAHMIDALKIRFLILHIPLRYQKQPLPAHHRLFHRQDGFSPVQIKMNHQTGKYRHSSEGNRRNPDHTIFRIFHMAVIFLFIRIFHILSCRPEAHPPAMYPYDKSRPVGAAFFVTSLPSYPPDARRYLCEQPTERFPCPPLPS